MFFSALILTTNQHKSELPKNSFALAAFFLMLAKVTANMSLQWVPYPTQVVGKGNSKNIIFNIFNFLPVSPIFILFVVFITDA